MHGAKVSHRSILLKQTDPNAGEDTAETGVITETTPISALLELTTNTTITATDDLITDSADDASDEERAGEAVNNESSIDLDSAYSGLLDGTIVANRTAENVIFFLEGELYRIAPLRSLGLQLPRSTALINLFSCDADTPPTEENCFWDPFLINRDGFYEVYNDAAAGFPIHLIMEQAGSPPENQIWIQNRTGARETVFYNDTSYEIPPSTVQEFDLSVNPAAKFYTKSCVAIGDEEVCEWVPKSLTPGVYYTLQGVSTSGGLPNSQIRMAELEALIAQGGEPVEAPVELLCQIQIPILNVRSGPGLEYLIITKIQATGDNQGTVRVVGRDLSEQWLAVDQNIANAGWITASAQFVQCDGAIGDLPIAEIGDGRLAPTPEPVVVAPVAEEGDNTAASADTQATEGEATEEETAIAVPEIPKGQTLLVVTNAFEHPIRFTLSPDEYDIQPGQVVYIIVNAGRIAFTASTAWGGGLSGNKDLEVAPDQTVELFIYFTPDPGDSDVWNMQYQ